jgi:hypothetical protein
MYSSGKGYLNCKCGNKIHASMINLDKVNKCNSCNVTIYNPNGDN